MQTPPGFQPFFRPRAHKDVERLSLHEGHQHCVQLICQHSQSVQRHHDFSRCVRFRHRCRPSFHGPRQDISPSKIYAHDEVLCASCPRKEITFRVLQWRRVTKASRVHQSWTGSCWIRSGYHCRAHCAMNCDKSVKAWDEALLELAAVASATNA